MIKIAIAGGPNSGKTNLSRQLTNKLCDMGKNAQYVSEFARDYINMVKAATNDEYHPSLTDQVVFFAEQSKREIIVPPTVDFLITDSPVFLSIIYTTMQYDKNDFQDRSLYLHLYSKALEFMSDLWTKYKYIFLVEPITSYNSQFQDGTRIQNMMDIVEIYKRVKGFLDYHGYEYACVNGNIDERVSKCAEILQ